MSISGNVAGQMPYLNKVHASILGHACEWEWPQEVLKRSMAGSSGGDLTKRHSRNEPSLTLVQLHKRASSMQNNIERTKMNSVSNKRDRSSGERQSQQSG